MTRLALAALVFAAARLARAEELVGGAAHEPEHGPWEMRVSVETPLYTHGELDSTNVIQETELEPDVMISYVLEEQRVSFDLEVGEGWVVLRSGGGGASGGTDGAPPVRTGTTIRPGVAYSPSREMPVFLTALLPIHLEPSPVVLSLRLGAGVNLAKTPIGKWFVEADLDFPLAGGDAPNPFQDQSIVLATGLLFHLPG